MEAFHTLCTNRRYDTPELTDAEILVMIISALEWKKHNGRIKLLTDNKGQQFPRFTQHNLAYLPVYLGNLRIHQHFLAF